MIDRVLVLCTANRIRSVVFAASLRRHAADHGWASRIEVASAGLLEPGRAPIPAAVAAAARLGMDVSGSRSVQLTREHLCWADLVLGAARSHVAEVYAMAPERFERAFTYVEFATLVGACEPRRPDESLDAFVGRIAPARTPLEVASGSPDLDVADPAGMATARVLQTGSELDRIAGRIAARTWPTLQPARI